ncbi:MAG: DUF1801 domain-containing protein [Fimbriimonas sp.]|nr:DUF1801 domain-containing protein [Fimbriimonas sp.]
MLTMVDGQTQTIDQYLSRVTSDEARASLVRLRDIIRDEIPDVEEVIKYGIPTFKKCGYIASVAAFKKHCSFFPGHTVNDFLDQLDGYKISKGTIQFAPSKPIPEPLVRAIVRARLAENLAASGDRT